MQIAQVVSITRCRNIEIRMQEFLLEIPTTILCVFIYNSKEWSI